MITREWIQEKIKEYNDAYMQALATANANNGARQAMESTLAEFDKQVEADNKYASTKLAKE
jgi:hypothetical protein